MLGGGRPLFEDVDGGRSGAPVYQLPVSSRDAQDELFEMIHKDGGPRFVRASSSGSGSSSSRGETSEGTVAQQDRKRNGPRERRQQQVFDYDDDKDDVEEEPPLRPSSRTRQRPASPPPTRQQPRTRLRPASPVPQPQTSALIDQWAADLNNVLGRALQPLLNMLGSIAVKLRIQDVRVLMMWDNLKRSPQDRAASIVQSAESVEAFVAANVQVIGRPLLETYIASVTSDVWDAQQQQQQGPQAIGDCFDITALDRNPPRTIGGASDGMSAQSRVLQAERQELHLITEFNHAVAHAQTARRALLDGTGNVIASTRADEAERAAQQALRNIQAQLTTLRQQVLLQDDVGRARQALGAQENEQLFAPAWSFQLVSDAAMRSLVSVPAWAAMEMAVAWVRRQRGCSTYTLRELICSPAIVDNFALVVAYQYLNTGDAATTDTGGSGTIKRRTGKTYLNVNKVRDQLQERMRVAADWFSLTVTTSTHPLLRRFDEHVRKERQARWPNPAALDAEPDARNQWGEKMALYRKALPQRELIVRPG